MIRPDHLQESTLITRQVIGLIINDSFKSDWILRLLA